MVIYFFIILLFILDIFSIFFISSIIGALITFMLLFVFMLMGFFIIKNLNYFVFNNISRNFVLAKEKLFNFKQITFLDLLSPLYVIFGAILLIIPGFLSDLIGIMILLPYLFNFIKKKNIRDHYNKSSNTYFYEDDSIIEGEFKEYKK